MTLDLGAKKQKVKKKVKFTATASVDATLVAEGKKIKETTTRLAADQETTIMAKLKSKARHRGWPERHHCPSGRCPRGPACGRYPAFKVEGQEAFMDDEIHPNTAGHQAIAEAFIDAGPPCP